MSESTPTPTDPTVTPEATPDALTSSLGESASIPTPDPETVPETPPADLVVDRVCPECNGTGEVSFKSTPFATGIKACPTCRPAESWLYVKAPGEVK